MGRNGRLDILREVGINGRVGVGGQKGDAFGDRAAHRFRWADDCNRLRVELDDNLSAGLHLSQDSPYIFGQFSLADMEYVRVHTWDDSAFGLASSFDVRDIEILHDE
jgi:hypothetical protein